MVSFQKKTLQILIKQMTGIDLFSVKELPLPPTTVSQVNANSIKIFKIFRAGGENHDFIGGPIAKKFNFFSKKFFIKN